VLEENFEEEGLGLLFLLRYFSSRALQDLKELFKELEMGFMLNLLKLAFFC
jgi:hypothetical protein